MTAISAAICTPGQICSAVAVLDEIKAGIPSHVSSDLTQLPQATAVELRERMSGNICRCGAYSNIVEAITEVEIAPTPAPANAMLDCPAPRAQAARTGVKPIVDAVVLVELEPLVGVRRLVGVVPHVQSFLLITAAAALLHRFEHQWNVLFPQQRFELLTRSAVRGSLTSDLLVVRR